MGSAIVNANAMVLHLCPRCGYATQNKSHMRMHLQRRIICPPNVSDADRAECLHSLDDPKSKAYTCNECGQSSFTSRSGLAYHQLHTCVCIKHEEQSQNARGEVINVATLRDEIRTQVLAEVREEIQSIRQSCERPPQPTTTNNHTIAQHGGIINQVNYNIMAVDHTNLREFGNESTDHIDDQFAKTCLVLGADGVLHMIRRIYFDPQHIENHNVQHASTSHQTVYVWKDGRWQLQTLQETVDRMVSASSSKIVRSAAPLYHRLDDDEFVGGMAAVNNLRPHKKSNIRRQVNAALLSRKMSSPALTS